MGHIESLLYCDMIGALVVRTGNLFDLDTNNVLQMSQGL